MSERLQISSHLANLVVAIAALFALVISSCQFHAAAEANSRAAAISVLGDYLKLSVEHEELADWPEAKPITDKYEWFASYALFTGETVFTYTHDAAWRSSVVSIVEAYKPYFRAGRFPCDDYDPKFVQFVKMQLTHDSIPLTCAAP